MLILIINNYILYILISLNTRIGDRLGLRIEKERNRIGKRKGKGQEQKKK